MITTKRLIATTLVAVLACSAVVLAASILGSRSASAAAHFDAVQPNLAAGFAVLHRPRVAADRVPDWAPGRAATQTQVDPALSRLALQTNDARIYLVPGSNELCMVTADVTGTASACTTATAALTRQPAVVEWLGSGYRVYAMQPDGTSNAVVTLADGTSVSLTEGQGVGVATVNEKPTSLTWTTATGTTQTTSLIAPNGTQ